MWKSRCQVGKPCNATVASKCTTRKATPEVMGQKDSQIKMLEPHRELKKSNLQGEARGKRSIEDDSLGLVLGYDAHLSSPFATGPLCQNGVL